MSHRTLRVLFGLALGAATAGALAGSGTDPADYNAFYAPAYQIPDPGLMGTSAARGKDIFRSTYRYLGAESGNVAANGKPYVGNKLACGNCHMDEGTRPYAVPLVVAAIEYADPKFSARENVARDLPIRINGCFERSLAGEMIPTDSQWMKDLIAYVEFLSTGLQPGYTWQQVPGQETRKPAALSRAASPTRGANIYQDRCRSCHQEDGSGVWRDDEKRFRYPALWEANSHGLMAGMGRLQTAAAFVYSNMPHDKVNALDPNTLMAAEDAWDVTAYLLSKPRPFNPRHITEDWVGVGPDGVPNALKRAVDASYDFTMPRKDAAGAWSIDPANPPAFPRSQHIYGPFQPITDALSQARKSLGY
ncbi:c-type cytochrome [Aromatoleum toluclasticum]|uniref:c-type cytochrome n=1 Tax=Aromatoleum toluclasticum TaxID=92003 RepID=UPI00036C6C8A|nr:c-type cytochrome [Aromatoleum toluclasticum]